jgi:hypothetical protein
MKCADHSTHICDLQPENEHLSCVGCKRNAQYEVHILGTAFGPYCKDHAIQITQDRIVAEHNQTQEIRQQNT